MPETKPADVPPADVLMQFILGLLTPFLMTGSITDPALARRAAAQAIAAHQAGGPDQPLMLAQIVAFALASLDTLRLSLPPELSLSMKLKLRGNAGALNRASQQAAAALQSRRQATMPPPEVGPPAELAPPEVASPGEPDPAETLAALKAARAELQDRAQAADLPAAAPAAAPATAPAAADLPSATPAPAPIATPAADREWASAMTDVAADYAAELDAMPPEQRGAHLARIGALTKVATLLGRGQAPPLKARLLASTAMPV